MIFVDTGAWFARFVADDPKHKQMQEWFAANREPLATTDYCVDETLTLLAVRRRPQLAIQAGLLLFDESLAKLHYLTQQQIERSWLLFQQRISAGWSFTDCTSKIAIEDFQMKTAVTLDRHFDQFGIQIVP